MCECFIGGRLRLLLTFEAERLEFVLYVGRGLVRRWLELDVEPAAIPGAGRHQLNGAEVDHAEDQIKTKRTHVLRAASGKKLARQESWPEQQQARSDEHLAVNVRHFVPEFVQQLVERRIEVRRFLPAFGAVRPCHPCPTVRALTRRRCVY